MKSQRKQTSPYSRLIKERSFIGMSSFHGLITSERIPQKDVVRLIHDIIQTEMVNMKTTFVFAILYKLRGEFL